MHIDKENISWFIGVVLAISANIISNLGLNFQKKAHSRREEQKGALSVSIENGNKQQQRNKNSFSSVSDDGYCVNKESTTSSSRANGDCVNKESANGSYVCDGVWLIGLFLQIVGALLDFAALGYAPQSVVAPLGSLTLVVNVMVSIPMHNEIPSMRTLLATFCIIIGAITTVASSPREDDIREVSQVFDLYEHTSFLIYASITGGFIACGWCLTQYFVYLSRNKQARYTLKYYKQHRFVIAAISGTMGAQNVLFAKSVSVLVVKSIENGGRSLFGHWETYILLGGLFSTIYFQLRWLNSGLKRFSALYVAPIFQAFWITVSVMGGLIVYKEGDDMIAWQRIVFPIGIIITICGVFYLTTQAKPKKYHKLNEEEEDDEDIIINECAEEDKLLLKEDIDEDNVEDPILSNEEDESEDIYDLNSIKLQHINHHNDEIEDKETDQDMGLMGLIKNIGEYSEASIITGSSLGKMLLDPHALYRDIHLGANEEDTHFKQILSPNLSQESLILNADKHKFAKSRKFRNQKNLAKQRSLSLGHFSDNDASNRSKSRRIKSTQRVRARARSLSPPNKLRLDEMAPHEVVWEKLTSIFVANERGEINSKRDSKIHSGYTSFDKDDDENDDDDDENDNDDKLLIVND